MYQRYMRITVHLRALPVVWPTKQNKVCIFSIDLEIFFKKKKYMSNYSFDILAALLETNVFKNYLLTGLTSHLKSHPNGDCINNMRRSRGMYMCIC